MARFDKAGDGPSDLGARVTIESLAEVVAALIEAVGGPAVVIGISIGGLIAQCLAAGRPNFVTALISSNTAARIGTPDS